MILMWAVYQNIFLAIDRLIATCEKSMCSFGLGIIFHHKGRSQLSFDPPVVFVYAF